MKIYEQVKKVEEENKLLRLEYYKACLLLAEANQQIPIANIKGLTADKWQGVIQRMIESQLRGTR